MRFFAVRIQPDVRKKESDRYVAYPSPKEYDHVWHSGKQDGFHECVNFKNFFVFYVTFEIKRVV